MIRYPYPGELDAIPRDRSTVIEASAGTGKTFIIEHLVVDRLIRGEATLPEILVVTFTDRAAAELLRRVRALVRRVLAADGHEPTASPAWVVDGPARARLEAAEQALDLAPISTIHAFCQGVLTEHAFNGGRLLAQLKVESRVAFRAELTEVVRRTLATDPELAPYLETWLRVNGSVERLERCLYQAWALRADWASSFDPARLARAAEAFAGLPPEAVGAAVRSAIRNGSSSKSVVSRLDILGALSRAFLAGGDVPRFLAAVDELVRDGDVFRYVEDRLPADHPATALLSAHLTELAEAALPLDTVVAQRFLPVVEARLRARKQAAGLYDFDDMLSLVADALGGPGGPALVEALRARYRLAIIDEFQDTDPVQWEIFRRVFHDSDSGGARPLYVVGDPKQAIYGFRGADVGTYAAACAALAPVSERRRLVRNFRSTPAVIDAYNAILDQRAEPPYFSGGTRYDDPVVSGRDAAVDDDAADDRPPIVLLRVTAEEETTRLPMRQVRGALERAIAAETARLLATPGGPRAEEIFVLTRTRRESEAIARAMAAVGVPHVLYNQEGLFVTDEARQVRDLLCAIEDPHDPAARLRAYLTPFFGLSISDLPAAATPEGGQALLDRLLGWHAMAEANDLARLYPRILDESGVVRRALFAEDGTRRLTNIMQLCDLLAADAARAFRPLGDVVRRLSALVAGLVIPAPEEGNVLHLGADRPAVQIMTMHKAKGLEADVVFVYGGFSPGPGGGIKVYTDDADGGVPRRRALIGRPRRNAVAAQIVAERDADDQRLYYVALTRARTRIYLPYEGAPIEDDEAAQNEQLREELWRLSGGYRHVNRRLRALGAEPSARRMFETLDVPVASGADDGDGIAARAAAALRGWRPDPGALAALAARPDPELARLRRARAGAVLTSYSRIKQAHGGYRPPTEIFDEASPGGDGAGGAPVPAAIPEGDGDARADDVPGGAQMGIFIHDLLENLPLPTLLDAPSPDAWAASPEVRPVIEAALRRHGRDPRHLPAAARLAHAALTAALPIVGGTLPGLIRAARVIRELEFLFPFPEAAGGADRGFVKGFIDVIFEHDGRAYFADWKTDRLPAWTAADVATHVDANYGLQEQLYALALVRMLGISDEAAYEARFGGTLYVFVRGLPAAAAVRSRRPSYADLRRWEAELSSTLAREVAP